MNIHTRTTRGFTLIELLVVIAIIGILASVVLASLNSARDKGADAAIKATVNNARAQAELYYDSNSNSYANICNAGTSTIASFKTGAESAGSGSAECASSASAWVLQAQLKSNTSQWYCVDSTGKATTSATDLVGTTDYAC